MWEKLIAKAREACLLDCSSVRGHGGDVGQGPVRRGLKTASKTTENGHHFTWIQVKKIKYFTLYVFWDTLYY